MVVTRSSNSKYYKIAKYNLTSNSRFHRTFTERIAGALELLTQLLANIFIFWRLRAGLALEVSNEHLPRIIEDETCTGFECSKGWP